MLSDQLGRPGGLDRGAEDRRSAQRDDRPLVVRLLAGDGDALVYALWKFRAKPGDESDGEPIHGNTRLEIAWTLIPTIIVLFGGAYSWKVLNEIEDKGRTR